MAVVMVMRPRMKRVMAMCWKKGMMVARPMERDEASMRSVQMMRQISVFRVSFARLSMWQAWW